MKVYIAKEENLPVWLVYEYKEPGEFDDWVSFEKTLRSIQTMFSEERCLKWCEENGHEVMNLPNIPYFWEEE